jgi:hypothetical protein
LKKNPEMTGCSSPVTVIYRATPLARPSSRYVRLVCGKLHISGAHTLLGRMVLSGLVYIIIL